MSFDTLRFEKWEGLGNDFIVVDREVTPTQARRLCDRRRGIGADGVLTIETLPDERFRMIVHNADGSRPEMCGNGLRCVAAYLARGRGAANARLRIVTDAGERNCEVTLDSRDRYEVAATMGSAEIGESFIYPPTNGMRRFQMVDVGNPHAVSFDPFTEEDVDGLGPAVEGYVDGGTNVEFCRLAEGRIEVVVWERGVGRTEACGTGACAVAAAACHRDFARVGEPIRVALPGGTLVCTVADDKSLTMRGPAVRVFAGETKLT